MQTSLYLKEGLDALCPCMVSAIDCGKAQGGAMVVHFKTGSKSLCEMIRRERQQKYQPIKTTTNVDTGTSRLGAGMTLSRAHCYSAATEPLHNPVSLTTSLHRHTTVSHHTG